MDASLTARLDSDLAWQVLDLAPVMVRDLDGEIQFWASGMQHMYGYAPIEALGQVSHNLLATKFPKALGDIEAELRDAGRWTGELVHRHKDGALVSVISEWVLLRGIDHAPRAIMVFNQDITRQREAERQLLELGGIVETSQDAIIGKTLDGVVTSWNRAAEEMFGYPAAEMIGQPIARLFPPDLAAEEQVILARLRAGERIEHYETTRVRKDGQALRVALSISAVHSPSGQIVGAAKIARDITEQEAFRQRLGDLQAELLHFGRLNDMGQMASGLAHELNQPLSAASNSLHGVRKLIERGDPERALEGCDRAAEQILRAGEVIRRLREFMTKGVPRRHVEDLNKVVEEACTLALVGARAAGVRVKVQLAPEPLRVLIDKIQIQQVILNLVRNAIEATAQHANPELTIIVEHDAVLAKVSVADNGSGLTKKIREKLFEPFNTSKSTGMGVGLSICRGIVEAHDGEIRASESPLGGALFQFTLPIR